MAESTYTPQRAYEEGFELYRQGDFSSAREAFRRVVEAAPADSQAWFALGNCYDGMKKPLQAEICFRKSLEFAGEEARSQVYFNLGNSLFDQNKFSQAIDCYAQVDAASVAFESAQRNLSLAKRARQ